MTMRPLLLPATAVLLLGGCVSSGYTYRGDRSGGDYYYGRPSVEYREVGPSGYGYYGYYGPYRYYYPGYGYRYRYPVHPYGYPDRHHHRYWYDPRYRHVRPRVDTTPDRPRSPWRDLDHLRRRQQTPPPPVAAPPPQAPVIAPSGRPGGSAPADRARRARERAEDRGRVQ